MGVDFVWHMVSLFILSDKFKWLTQSDLIRKKGLNSKSITNYAQVDLVPTHWAIVALLMGEMAGNGLEFKQLIQKLDIRKNKVRGAAAPGKFGGGKQESLDIFNLEDNNE